MNATELMALVSDSIASNVGLAVSSAARMNLEGENIQK